MQRLKASIDNKRICSFSMLLSADITSPINGSLDFNFSKIGNWFNKSRLLFCHTWNKAVATPNARAPLTNLNIAINWSSGFFTLPIYKLKMTSERHPASFWGKKTPGLLNQALLLLQRTCCGKRQLHHAAHTTHTAHTTHIRHSAASRLILWRFADCAVSGQQQCGNRSCVY